MAASGREYTNLRNLFAPVADDIAYLCLNGCLTFYHNECISKEIMDTTIARKLITTIQNPQLFLKVPLLILLLVKVPFFNMMSLEMVLAVSRKEAIIWLPAVINIYL